MQYLLILYWSFNFSLSREETIDHLLDFVITPVNPEEGELRIFK